MQLKFKTEALIFLFGALVILLTFGDNHTGPNIGNLDTIFGLRLWPIMDAIYPLASILFSSLTAKQKTKKTPRVIQRGCCP